MGQRVEIRNSDDLLHNVHASSSAGGGFNVGQPREGLVYTFQPAAPEIMMHLGCDVHRWMTSYIGIVSHPYFDVTSGNSVFRIDNVPAGTYTIQTWYEVYGELSRTVEIREGETATMDLEYSVDESSG